MVKLYDILSLRLKNNLNLKTRKLTYGILNNDIFPGIIFFIAVTKYDTERFNK